MDELKLSLSTKFMKGIVAKLIARAVRKKVGCNVNVWVNEVRFKHDGNRVYIHADVDADMNNSELMKLMKEVELE